MKRYIAFSLLAAAGMFAGWLLWQVSKYVFSGAQMAGEGRVGAALCALLVLGFAGSYPGFWEKV